MPNGVPSSGPPPAAVPIIITIISSAPACGESRRAFSWRGQIGYGGVLFGVRLPHPSFSPLSHTALFPTSPLFPRHISYNTTCIGGSGLLLVSIRSYIPNIGSARRKTSKPEMKRIDSGKIAKKKKENRKVAKQQNGQPKRSPRQRTGKSALTQGPRRHRRRPPTLLSTASRASRTPRSVLTMRASPRLRPCW